LDEHVIGSKAASFSSGLNHLDELYPPVKLVHSVRQVLDANEHHRHHQLKQQQQHHRRAVHLEARRTPAFPGRMSWISINLEEQSTIPPVGPQAIHT
jgi:hypothetical protein